MILEKTTMFDNLETPDETLDFRANILGII